MIFGHDFKYRIPEMDMLLGAAADIGLHFPYSKETANEHKEGLHIVQVASVKTGETAIMFTASKMNAEKREVTA